MLKDKIIVTIKDIKDLAAALETKSKTVFLLCGDICSIEEITRELKSVGKTIFVHIDMIAGLDSKENITIDFIKNNTFADGIISTKPSAIKYAKKEGLYAIQRCFLLDSLSFENSKKLISNGGADALEILPGVMPKVIKRIVEEINIPLIAGGLISDLEDIETALAAGATAVSTTKKSIWKESGIF